MKPPSWQHSTPRCSLCTNTGSKSKASGAPQATDWKEAAGKPQLVVFDGFNAEERLDVCKHCVTFAAFGHDVKRFAHYVWEKLPNAMRVLDMQDFHALRLGTLLSGQFNACRVNHSRCECHMCAAVRMTKESDEQMMVCREHAFAFATCAVQQVENGSLRKRQMQLRLSSRQHEVICGSAVRGLGSNSATIARFINLKASYRPSAIDEDLQRELAAIHRSLVRFGVRPGTTHG